MPKPQQTVTVRFTKEGENLNVRFEFNPALDLKGKIKNETQRWLQYQSLKVMKGVQALLKKDDDDDEE